MNADKPLMARDGPPVDHENGRRLGSGAILELSGRKERSGVMVAQAPMINLVRPTLDEP